jgi:hypothetical protein
MVGEDVRQLEDEIDECIQKMDGWSVKRDVLLRRITVRRQPCIRFRCVGQGRGGRWRSGKLVGIAVAAVKAFHFLISAGQRCFRQWGCEMDPKGWTAKPDPECPAGPLRAASTSGTIETFPGGIE